MCNNNTILQEKVGLRELQYINKLSHSNPTSTILRITNCYNECDKIDILRQNAEGVQQSGSTLKFQLLQDVMTLQFPNDCYVLVFPTMQ